MKIYQRIDKDLDQYIYSFGWIFEFLTIYDLNYIDNFNIIKEYYNLISHLFYVNLVNHLSTSYEIQGLGKKFIENLKNGEEYVHDNIIRYNMSHLIKDNCKDMYYGVGITKNIATINNIYLSEFSQNVFDSNSLNYYMVQIGDMTFYIDNGSILNILMNEYNFNIEAVNKTIIDEDTGLILKNYIKAWQFIDFQIYGQNSDELNTINLSFHNVTGPIILQLELYRSSIGNPAHGINKSANPDVSLAGLELVGESDQIVIDSNTDGLTPFNFTNIIIDSNNYYYYILLKDIQNNGFSGEIKFISNINETMLLADDGEIADFFGDSVAINNNTLAVGSYGNNNKKGAIYVFENDNNSWIQQQKLIPSDVEDDDKFSLKSISISENYIIGGSPCDNVNGTNSGSAYILKKIIIHGYKI